MATVIHHHETVSVPAGVYWVIGFVLALMVTAVLLMWAAPHTEMASIAPTFLDPPLFPPAVPFLPLM